MSGLIFKKEVYAVVGAAMEVYNVMGSGFLEAVYQEALQLELTSRRIPYVAQQELHICYKGQPLHKTYIPDFIVFDRTIVEIKAIDRLTVREEAQLINYLKATGLQLGG